MRAETEAPGVKTRLTADWLTPAARATSSEVAVGAVHSAVQPPSTISAVPVIRAAASEARKTVGAHDVLDLADAAELDLALDPGAAFGVGEGGLGQRRCG